MNENVQIKATPAGVCIALRVEHEDPDTGRPAYRTWEVQYVSTEEWAQIMEKVGSDLLGQ